MPGASETRQDAFARIRTEFAAAEERHFKRHKSLPIREIRTEPAVFQHREDDGETRYAIDFHIKELVSAIKREPSNRLDAVTVWRCGKRWIVLDGHYRLEAYQLFADEVDANLKTFKVPVRVFEGTPIEAWDFSALANKKAAAPLTATERSNAMWCRVCMSWQDGTWASTQAELAALGLTSKRSIIRMRQALRELVEVEGVPLGEAMGMTWAEVMRREKETGEIPDMDADEEKRRATEKEWADRLRRQFGVIPIKAPLMFLAALEVYSPKMVEDITDYLAGTDEDEDEMVDF